IESTSYKVMLYLSYLKEGVRCKMINRIKSCSQCTKQSCSCNAGWVLISFLFCITNELVRLNDREMEKKEYLLKCQRELADAQARLSESLDCLSCLKKQQRFLQEKGIKLV
ncbi:hypothetical protein M406DRAFT_221465, partial [Cryphonectria parasitica EP155]